MMSPRVLLIDDEPDILELLTITLNGMSIESQAAISLATAKEALRSQQFDFCLTDMRLPDGNGLDIVKMVQQDYPDMPVAVISAHGNMSIAVQALKDGAFDFISKPVKLQVLRELVDTALKLIPQHRQAVTVESEETLIGETAVVQRLRQKITKLARSQASVYISGESGTGKELAAKLIHRLSVRRTASFVAINCGAIPSELMESEFFGHKKGAFTGAVYDKTGLFEQANGGTLFLDEVADLPLAMQVKLLRVLQEKKIRPIGSHSEKQVDVRVLCATHKDLADKVKEGEFREDLFYRLNVIELVIPPLRERRADLPLLIEVILQRLAKKNQLTVIPKLSQDALFALSDYPFNGNIRELENILERALTWMEQGVITESDLMLQPVKKAVNTETALTEQQNLEHHLELEERQLIEAALESVRWNKTKAAKKLGISFRALRYRLKKLGID